MLRRLFAGVYVYVTKSALVLCSGTALFVGYEVVTLNEKFYENQVMPFVHRFVDGETSHRLSVMMAKYGILLNSRANSAEYSQLRSTVFGRHFANPIGLAAGFDKNGEAIESLRSCGFGFVEVGSVTPLPQFGNSRPRVFRLIEDKAVINRYGFNNDGLGAVHERVRKAYNSQNATLLGVNLGKNKTTTAEESDYEVGATYFAPYCDYLVINVSSPNTPGLRALQSKQSLIKILQTVQNSISRVVEYESMDSSKRPKVLLKIAPDLSDEDTSNIAKVCLDKKNGVDGLIISNTTVSRPEALRSTLREETGGLSGTPLRQLSTDRIAQMYRLTNGRVPIVGCGGVVSGEDAYEKILAGASLVQLYSALVYQGFPALGRVKRELVECLKRDGFSMVGEAVGAAHRNDPRISSSYTLTRGGDAK